MAEPHGGEKFDTTSTDRSTVTQHSQKSLKDNVSDRDSVPFVLSHSFFLLLSYKTKISKIWVLKLSTGTENKLKTVANNQCCNFVVLVYRKD